MLPMQHGHPYISAMVSNGTFHYDHDRDGTHTALDGCEASFRHAKHETFIAVRYERNRLMVCEEAIELKLLYNCMVIYYFRQRRRYMFCPCLSVCLSACLLARLLKNVCMDLDEMLHVDKCRGMDKLINF